MKKSLPDSVENQQKPPLAVVRGIGDVGSAIIWTLFQAGYSVIAHEDRQPRTIRRKMAFCDALWEGSAELEGVRIEKVSQLDSLLDIAHHREHVVLFSGGFDAMIRTLAPKILVDARIQKFASIVSIRGLAELTLGIGPSFIAKNHVDFVIESCWGDALGRVIEHGQAAEPVPVPPRLDGIGWERFIRAPEAGRFESELAIGQYVKQGEVIGVLNSTPVKASIDGHLRGLLYPGLSVLKDEKLCEIDPRGNKAHFSGLAERPEAIADGVMKAISVCFDEH